MSPAFRRFLLVLTTLAGVLAALRFAAVPAVRSYLSYQAPCSQPCRDGRNCQPVSLSLELARPWAKAGKRYQVWYKVKLVNRSCFSLSINSAGFLLGGFSNLSETVLDPDGKPVEEDYDLDRAPPSRPAEPIKLLPYGVPHGPVKLYQRDLSEWEHLLASKKSDGDGWIDLEPGEELVSQGFTLSPRREVIVEQFYPDGSRGHGDAWVSVPAPPGAEKPPAGYTPLPNHVFKRPGQYQLLAKYQGSPYGRKKLPRFRALPKLVQKSLWLIENYLELDVIPESGSKVLNIEAVSNSVQFEVRP